MTARSRVMLSVAWFVIGLAGFIAAGLVYGWLAAPVGHVWHAAAYLVFMTWIIAARWLHPDRRPGGTT